MAETQKAYRAVNAVIDRNAWGVEGPTQADPDDTEMYVYPSRALSRDAAEKIARALNALAVIASNDLIGLTGAGAVVAAAMRDEARAALAKATA